MHVVSAFFMTLSFSLSLSVDSKPDEADGWQLWGRPPEGHLSKLRAAQQSQALPRPGKISARWFASPVLKNIQVSHLIDSI